VVIFSFSGSAAAPSKFIYISLHESPTLSPGQIATRQPGLLPGGKRKRKQPGIF